MSRTDGSGRRSGRRSSPTLFQQALALSLVWFDASGHITLSGTGDVLSIHDRKDDTHVLTQADTAKQVDPPAAHADFNDELCFTFVAASVTHYVSSRSLAYWRDVHNGVGNQPTLVWTPLGTGRPLGTRATGTGPIGCIISCDSAPNLSAFFGNGTANLNLAPGVGGATSGTPTYARTQLLGTTGRLWSKSTKISEVGSYTPSAGDPVSALTYGAGAGGAVPHSMRSPMVLVWPPSAPVEPLQQYFQQEYGIPP